VPGEINLHPARQFDIEHAVHDKGNTALAGLAVDTDILLKVAPQ
jgi:hypothetical protein